MAGRNDAAYLMFFVIGIPSCFVLPYFLLKDCHVAAFLAMTRKCQVFRENLPFLFPNCLRFVAERHRHSVPPGRCIMRPRKDNAEGWIVLFKGNSDSIARVVGEGFCSRLKLRNRRNPLRISRVLNRSVGAKDPLSAADDRFRGSLDLVQFPNISAAPSSMKCCAKKPATVLATVSIVLKPSALSS